jgi:hypothetical protein
MLWIHCSSFLADRILEREGSAVPLSILFAVPDAAFQLRIGTCGALFAITAESLRLEKIEPSGSGLTHHTSWRHERNIPDERSSFRRWGKDAIELFALQHWTIRISRIGAG